MGIEKTPNELPQILKGPVTTFTLYEVTDDELLTLENGPADTYFNFAFGFFSMAVSFLIAILAGVSNIVIYTTFLVFTMLPLIAGIGFSIAGFKERKNYKATINKIRSRLKTYPNSNSNENQINPEIAATTIFN